MMIDIDFFKQFNDTYGHMEGDKCLQNISAVFNTTINRASDFVARFGGEEFIILLEDTDKNGAVKVATDIQNNIHNLRIPHDTSSVNPYITVSIGIVVAHPDSSSVKETLVQNADKALYQAKNNGRNCIDVFKL
jgi:diguanylate cyclase (GGDEF)-like protein